MTVAVRFALDAETTRPPDARAHEYRRVTIIKEVVEVQGAAQRRMRADMHTEGLELLLVGVENLPRQAKIGNAVTHHAAETAHALEDRYIVAVLRQLRRHREARRPRADDRHTLLLARRMLHQTVLVQIGIRDVVLNGRNLHGTGAMLLAQNAVSFALLFMVANQRTDIAHGIVLEQHDARLIAAPRQKEANHLRNIRLQRTPPLHAQRFLALQAAPRLVNDMYSHSYPLIFLFACTESYFHSLHPVKSIFSLL